MGSSPPATVSQTDGSASSSLKSAWASPLPEASVSRSKPVVKLVDGVARVSVPTDIIEESFPLWKCFVVGYFMGDAPHLGTIHATVNRIWNTVSKASRIDVQFLSPKTVLFRIESEQTRARVLKRKYWHIADVPLVVNEWSPETVHDKPSLSAMPLWVDFRGVPGFLFSQKGLRFLADISGDFVRLHPNTERCTRLDMARILVEVNLEKELTEKICVEDKEGNEFFVSVSYPWLPLRCNKCLGWGHKADECSKRVAVGGAASPKSPIPQNEANIPASSEPISSSDPITVVAALVTELENVSVSVGEVGQSGPELAVNTTQTPVSDPVNTIGENVTAKSQTEQVNTAGVVLSNEEMREIEQGWSVALPSRKTSPSRKFTEKTELPPGSITGFRVLENTLEDGEIEETETVITQLEEENSLEVSVKAVGSTKSVGKRNGKQKQQRRPILNKKDMLQVRPQINAIKASSRKC